LDYSEVGFNGLTGYVEMKTKRRRNEGSFAAACCGDIAGSGDDSLKQ